MTADDRAGGHATRRARLIGFARRIIEAWALLGGLILVLLVLMTAASALSNLLFNRPFTGDFELVKHGVAIAAFAFLPYCQLTYSNVTVDIFTEQMSARAKAAMVLLASVVAAAFAVLLLRQMWFGMFDYITYRESMVSLPVQLWTAFPPALVSLALLLIASLITAGEAIASLRAPPQPV
jgi:TRAP-type C4-dicarboxylate transport system permease small subunit